MITKNYIKQCEKAKEIQKLWKPKCGDWCADPDHDAMVITSMGSLTGTKRWNKWLPTQEQLFNMLLKWCQTDKILTNLLVGESINRYILKELYYYTDTFEGMLFVSDIKELTLSYIYKRMYHKVWTGENWKDK